jgi:peptidoglycan/LPS O-acetylase OafA/YrhL/lysophospholipase L1-like esterase
VAEGSVPGARLAHQPALDGLRGVAVIGVLLFHGGKLTGGYLGVDAFFVLSGFLITSLLLAEHGASGVTSLRRFWARRARRLFPALLLMLVGVALYSWLVLDPASRPEVRGDSLATLLYVANWREVVAGSDYFALFRDPSPLEHTWSLAIEEQFYVLWPLVFVLLTRGRDAATAARRVLVVATGGAVGSFALAQVLYSDRTVSLSGSYVDRVVDALTTPSANRVYFGTDTRIGAIFVGAALAAWTALHSPRAEASRGRSALEVAGWLAVGGLALAWVRLPGDSTVLYRGGLIVCGLAVTVVIAAATHPERGWLHRALSWAPLRAAGLVSYGLYLFHWPVYVWLNEERTDQRGWALLAVRVAVTVVLALVSYRLVEQPIRRGAGSVQRWRIVTPAVVVAVVAATIAGTAGAPAASSALRVRGKGGVAIVGDSVAQSLYPGFVDARYRVRLSWAPGCRLLHGELPFENSFSNECPWDRSFAAVVEQADPDVVVLAIGVWDLFDLTPPGGDGVLVPGTTEWAAYFDEQMERAVTILSSRGAGVVIPTLPCQNPIRATTDLRGRPSSADVDRVEAWNAALAKVAARHPGVVATPDLFGHLCPDRQFERTMSGVVVRPDGVHYTPDGANLVAEFLRPALFDVARRTDRLELDASVALRTVSFYGDGTLNEVTPLVGDLLADRHDLRVLARTADGSSLCDLAAWFGSDLGTENRPVLAVLETNGGAFTECMAAARPSDAGEAAFYAKYRSDFRRFFATAESADVPVVVVAPPPSPDPRVRVVHENLWRIAEEEAAAFDDVVLMTAARDAVGGASFVASLPCRENEEGPAGCVDGEIPVRSPDGVSFCPTGYVTGAPCPVYSSGASRYAEPIAEAVRSRMGPPVTEG